MRFLRRLAGGTAAVAGLSMLLATTAVAGGWAEVTLIGGGDDPPSAGEPHEIRISVLQHGVTPVDSGTVLFTASAADGSEEVSVEATSAGGGEWIATVTFPVEGDWEYRVTHSAFETPEARHLAVTPAAALTWLPGALALTAVLGVVVALAMTQWIGDRRPSAGELSPNVVRTG